MKTQEQLKAEGFILVDCDTNQWIKKITETHFLVYEKEQEYDIELNDYTEEQLEDYTSAYYKSLSGLREIYGINSNQIIAECIAEQEYN